MWSEVRCKLAIVNLLHTVPRCTSSLASDLLLVDTQLICFLICPFGALPRLLSVLLRCILASSVDIFRREVLLDSRHGHITGDVGKELICLRLFLFFLLLLASGVGAHVFGADFGLRSFRLLISIPVILIVLGWILIVIVVPWLRLLLLLLLLLILLVLLWLLFFPSTIW